MVLKPSMVIAGQESSHQSSIDAVAEATVKCLLKNVPATVTGIAFLSGGQSNEQASAHLNLMNERFYDQCPWPITFSYGRAIQQPALDYWQGDSNRVAEAQKRLLHRAKCNSLASLGKYNPDVERELGYG